MSGTKFAHSALRFVPIFLLFSVPLCSQDSRIPFSLHLRDAVRIALERNPSLKIARQGVAAAEGQRIEASKRLNPAFSFTSENWRAFSTDQGPFFGTQDLTARFDYEIETRGRRELRTRAANRAIETAKSMVEDRRRFLILEVERAYFRAVLAQSDLGVAQNILAQIDRLISLNRARYTSGEISGAELKRSELERLRFQDDVFSSQLDLRNAKADLLALLYIPNFQQDFQLADPLKTKTQAPTELQTSLATLPLEQLQQQALQRRPDLAAANREEERADTETLLQQALRSPNVTVSGGFKRAGPYNSVVYGVVVPLRIFNRNEGGIARAQAELSRARNQAALVRTTIELEVQKAFNSVEVNRERVRYIEREYLTKAEDALRVVQAAYRLGEANLMDLLDSERSYRETQRTYHRALYEYRVSLCELSAASGEEFPL